MIIFNFLKGFNIKNSKKEILYILLSFVVLISLTMLSKAYNMYRVDSINNIITDLYEHPLKVSNAALAVQINVYKIQRNMKDIILTPNNEVHSFIKKINQNEKDIYTNLKIIELNILGDKGKHLHKETFKLFKDWKALRDKIIALPPSNKLELGIKRTQSKDLKHIDILEKSTNSLYEYTKTKADVFKQKSDDSYSNYLIQSVIISLFLFLLAVSTVTYIIKRLSMYMLHAESLNKELLDKKNELLQTNKQLSNITDNVPGVIYTFQSFADGRSFYPFASEHMYEVCGITVQEVKEDARKAFALIHPEDLERVTKRMQTSVEELTLWEDEYRYVHPDKGTIWLKGVAKPEKQLDGSILAYGYVYDITKEKKAQSLLADSNSLLKKLSDTIPAAIYQYRLYPDGSSSFPYASIGIEDVYEVIPETVTNNAQAVFDVLHPDDLNMIVDSINTSAETMKQWSLEYRVQLPKKGLRWLRGHAKPQKLEDGSVLWHGFIEDITESKLIEQIHRESEERFRSITTSAQDAIIMMDNNGNISYWNKAAEIIFGYTQEEATGKILSSLIVPEKFFTAHNVGIKKFKTTGIGAVVGKTIELSGLKKNGMEFPIELSLSSVLKDGRWNAIGIIRDISERKKLENELKASQHQFELFMQNIPMLVFIKDNEHKIIYANKYTQDYFNGKNIIGLKAEEILSKEDAIKARAFDKLISKGKTVDLVSQFTNTNNETKTYRSMGFKIEDNGIKKGAIVMMDITQEYKIRKLLQQKKEELETIIQEAPNPIILHNEDGKIIMLNQAWVDASGYSLEETPTIDAWVESIFDDTQIIISIKKHIRSMYEITEKVDEGDFTFLIKMEILSLGNSLPLH